MEGNSTQNCTALELAGGADSRRFGEPMLWIGLYVLFASVLCAAAVGADVIRSIRWEKIWISPKFFVLNAAVLTILGVAVKIPNDINGTMPGALDQSAKVSGILLLCVAMVHAMPSLGVMGNWELLSNMVALGILVVSTAVNICFQIHTGVITKSATFTILLTIGMLLLFSILVSYSLSVATIKLRLEQRYQSKHWEIDREVGRRGVLSGGELRVFVKKFWLMAFTSSPDVVLVTSGFSGPCVFLYAIISGIFFAAAITNMGYGKKRCFMRSDYKWTTGYVLYVQLVPIFLVSLSGINRAGFHGVFGMQFDSSARRYRFEQLRKWERDPLSSLVRNERVRSAAYHAKNLGVRLLILFQMIVTFLAHLPSNVISFIVFSTCFRDRGEERPEGATERELRGAPSRLRSGEEEDLSGYALSFVGMGDGKILAMGFKDYPDKWFAIGQARKPIDLPQLLGKSSSPSSSSSGGGSASRVTFGDLGDCWSLHLSTLVCVVYAAFGGTPRGPSGAADSGTSLLRALDEGFLYFTLVDANKGSSEKKALDAAKMVWENLRFRRQWLDKPLLDKQSDIRDTIRGLKAKAEGHVPAEHENEGLPVQLLSLEAVAAISMSRITRALLEGNRPFSLVEMEAEWAGVAESCLEKLPAAILRECSNGGYGYREVHVRLAAQVLGETQEMLEKLGALRLSSSDAAPV